MARVLVSGSLAYDRIMDFPGLFKDHFLADKLHAISVSFQVETVGDNFGGCAGNIAYNLSLLGHEPHIIATAGSDIERYKAHLKAHGIDTNTIRINPQGFTSSAYVMTDKADNQIAAFSLGAGGTPYQPLPSTEGAALAIIGPGCVRDMQVLPQHYRAAGVPYMYDPGQAIPALSADDLKDGIAGAAAVFANDYEFDLISKKTGWAEKDVVQKAETLVVTYGDKGSRIITKAGESSVGSVPVEDPIDPTGAGDAYRAGYIAGYLKGFDREKCAKIASALASFTVEKYGTQTHALQPGELATRYKERYDQDLPL
ncbi:MAG: carbohydrate kinase family protein [Candidatus Kaiserbacteria bacterium]|nr:MAG: carbohydrate kinase family protein [Candidatus Kaiserbacteria bacterium]